VERRSAARLGRSVGVVGLGCWQLGADWGEVAEDDALGVLAAAAMHALDHHIDRLADDHIHARRLAAAFEGLAPLSVEPPQTNMVFVDLPPARSKTLVPALAERGVLTTGLYRLRFVTHLDVTAADIDRAAAVIREVLSTRALTA